MKALEVLGPNHTLKLDIFDNIGAFHRSLDRLEEAETTDLQALDDKMKALGPVHVLTANSLST